MSGRFWIKLISVAVLALAVWPIPAMVSFANPSEGTLFGRYTPTYFLLMVGYLSGAAAWAAITGWALWRLDESRLLRLRAAAGRHLRLVMAGSGLVMVGIVGLRSLALAQLVVFPAALAGPMRIIPGLSLPLLAALLALTLGEDLLRRMDRALELRGRGAWTAAQRIAPLVGLVVTMAALVITIAPRTDYWQFPLLSDPSVHIYIGQHVLRGGMPYQTVFYQQPALRFPLSVAWNLGARGLGLPVVPYVRALDLAVSAGLLALTYLCAREFTGRPLGGLLGAVFLLGTGQFYELLIPGPTFRLTIALFMLLGLWLAQRERWAGAGAFAAAASLMWVPACAALGGILLAALLQDRAPHWRAAARVLAGTLAVLTVTALVLGPAGVLDDAYRQSVLSVFSVVSDKLGRGQQPDAAARRLESVQWFLWSLRGKWELATLTVLGPLLTLWFEGARRALRLPQKTALFGAAALMSIVMLAEYYGSARDSFMLIVIVPAFGAAAVVYCLQGLLRGHILTDGTQQGMPHLEGAFGWATAGLMLVYGLADNAPRQGYLYGLTDISLRDQEAMATQLDNLLAPGETVQVTGSLWYLVFTSRDNATPVMQWDEKGFKAALLSGWSMEHIVSEWSRIDPVVLMLTVPPPSETLSRWLDSRYVFMGQFNADYHIPQYIYVRQGHPALADAINRWPLEHGEDHP